MQIVTGGNDLEGIEPSKSFRNAEDSVPYGALKESDKLKFAFPGLGKIGIYFFCKMVYDSPEQSRRPRVKCYRDGELPGGRRIFLR